MEPQHWQNVDFQFSLSHVDVYISLLIIVLINEFEIDKFYKKCTINTNAPSSLDASWNNFSAYFCQSVFFSSRVNSFLLKNRSGPTRNSLPLHWLVWPSRLNTGLRTNLQYNTGCIPSQGTWLGCGPGPLLGPCQEATTH